MFKIKSITPGGLAQPQRRGGAAPAGAHPRAAPGSAQPQFSRGGGRSQAVNPKSSARKKISPPKEVSPPQQGCHGVGRNYLLLQELPSPAGSAFLSSRPPPVSAAPGSERCLWPTAETENLEWEQQDQNQGLRAEGWFLPASPATGTVSCSCTALMELNSPNSLQHLKFLK